MSYLYYGNILKFVPPHSYDIKIDRLDPESNIKEEPREEQMEVVQENKTINIIVNDEQPKMIELDSSLGSDKVVSIFVNEKEDNIVIVEEPQIQEEEFNSDEDWDVEEEKPKSLFDSIIGMF